MPAKWRRYGTNVFELVPDPASDIIGGDGLADRLRSPVPFGNAHLQRPMDGSRGYLDVKRIDAQRLGPELLMGAG